MQKDLSKSFHLSWLQFTLLYVMHFRRPLENSVQKCKSGVEPRAEQIWAQFLAAIMWPWLPWTRRDAVLTVKEGKPAAPHSGSLSSLQRMCFYVHAAELSSLLHPSWLYRLLLELMGKQRNERKSLSFEHFNPPINRQVVANGNRASPPPLLICGHGEAPQHCKRGYSAHFSA